LGRDAQKVPGKSYGDLWGTKCVRQKCFVVAGGCPASGGGGGDVGLGPGGRLKKLWGGDVQDSLSPETSITTNRRGPMLVEKGRGWLGKKKGEGWWLKGKVSLVKKIRRWEAWYRAKWRGEWRLEKRKLSFGAPRSLKGKEKLEEESAGEKGKAGEQRENETGAHVCFKEVW